MTGHNLFSRAASGRRFSRRGSVLVLVIVMLALMVLLGMAYLQVARVDRAVTAIPTNNIDPVVTSVLSMIANTLAIDLTNSTNVASGDLSDYPFDGPQIGGTLGQQDKYWLGTPPTINGVVTYLKVPLLSLGPILTNWNNSNGTFGNATNLQPVPVYSSSNTNTSDAWAPTAWLTDPAGSGIPCAVWQWAPIMRNQLTAYVMTAYVVDLSSLVNVNTAANLVNATGQYDTTANGAAAPHWFGPVFSCATNVQGGGIDLGNFVFQSTNSVTTSAATWMSQDLPNMLAARIVGNTNTFLWDDEQQLRFRNGLVDPTTQTPLMLLMPNFLRLNSTGEINYTYFPNPASPAAQGDAAMNAFLQNEPRHQMTTFNGYVPLAPVLPADGTTNYHYKFDLNNSNTNNAPTITAIVGEILKVLGTNGGTSSFTTPVGWGAAATNRIQFGYTLAAQIKNYSSTDNQLFEADYLTNKYYGLAPLPFVTEVYAQREYTATVTNGTNGFDTVRWGATSGIQNTGYIIEVCNPFTTTNDLTTVDMQVGASDWGTLSSLTAKNTLAPGEVIILYLPSVSTTNLYDSLANSTTGAPAGLVDPSMPSSEKFPLTFTWPIVTTYTTNNSVRLYAANGSSSGQPMSWPYQTVPITLATNGGGGLPLSWTPQQVPTGSVTNGIARMCQLSVVGNGHGLNAITVKHVARGGTFGDSGANDTVFRQVLISATNLNATAYTYNTSLTHLGLSNKSLGIQDAAGTTWPGGPPDILLGPTGAPDVTKNPIWFTNGLDIGMGPGRINYVGELAHLVVLPLDGTKTIPQAWNDQQHVTDFMLDFSTNAPRFAPSGNLNVPYSVVLLERFTTLRPNGEVFIPGGINVNTMTTNLMMKVLPIPDPTLRQNVVNAIDAYRKNPTRNNGNSKGVAFMGELYYQLGLNTTNMPGNDGVENRSINGTAVDFLKPNGNTGFYDDREEQMLIPRLLNQVCTTRSDTFAVYVLIRGYPANNFTQDPIEAARFLAIFDRSTVFTTGQVRLVCLYRYY